MNIPVTIPCTDHRETEEIAKVIASGWLTQGPKVTEFEKAVAAHEGVSYGVATTSCTTALHLTLHALGIGQGQDVIVPSFTFVASANSVVHTGAKPRFVDVLKETYCIDPASVSSYIEENYVYKGGKLEHKQDKSILVAIMAVHQFGLCADIPALSKMASKHGLMIIEDSACALGAKIGGRCQGTFGNPSCLSFHPRKSITTGEGGMVLTDDKELAVRMKSMRTHGAAVSADDRHKKMDFLLPSFDDTGYNYRMTDIQAAIGLAQMEKLNYILETRRKRAMRYNELLAGLGWIATPIEPDGYFHTYQSYVCMLKTTGISSAEGGMLRDRLLTLLAKDGIATRQGAHACHMLECYRKMYGIKPEEIPNAYACDRLSITLPLFIQMTDEQQDYVVEKLKEAYICLQ